MQIEAGGHGYDPKAESNSLAKLLDRTSNLPSVSRALSEDWESFKKEFFDFSTIIPFQYEVSGGRWRNNGRTIEEITDEDSLGQTKLGRILAAEKRMLNDPDLTQSIVISEDTGSGRSYLYVYNRDQSDLNKINALAIEYQGEKKELTEFIGLLGHGSVPDETFQPDESDPYPPLFFTEKKALTVENIFESADQSYADFSRKKEMVSYLDRLSRDVEHLPQILKEHEHKVSTLADLITKDIKEHEDTRSGIAAVAYAIISLSETYGKPAGDNVKANSHDKKVKQIPPGRVVPENFIFDMAKGHENGNMTTTGDKSKGAAKSGRSDSGLIQAEVQPVCTSNSGLHHNPGHGKHEKVADSSMTSILRQWLEYINEIQFRRPTGIRINNTEFIVSGTDGNGVPPTNTHGVSLYPDGVNHEPEHRFVHDKHLSLAGTEPFLGNRVPEDQFINGLYGSFVLTILSLSKDPLWSSWYRDKPKVGIAEAQLDGLKNDNNEAKTVDFRKSIQTSKLIFNGLQDPGAGDNKQIESQISGFVSSEAENNIPDEIVGELIKCLSLIWGDYDLNDKIPEFTKGKRSQVEQMIITVLVSHLFASIQKEQFSGNGKFAASEVILNVSYPPNSDLYLNMFSVLSFIKRQLNQGHGMHTKVADSNLTGIPPQILELYLQKMPENIIRSDIFIKELLRLILRELHLSLGLISKWIKAHGRRNAVAADHSFSLIEKLKQRKSLTAGKKISGRKEGIIYRYTPSFLPIPLEV